MEGLAADRAMVARTSTAERVAEILRWRTSGTALAVSRNAPREAFWLLAHVRVLAPNREMQAPLDRGDGGVAEQLLAGSRTDARRRLVAARAARA